jgi:hypothetical protein
MSSVATFTRRAYLIGLVSLLSLSFPGCASDRMVCPQRDGINVVRRPTYEGPGEKTMYLGGYAGATYDPANIPGR